MAGYHLANETLCGYIDEKKICEYIFQMTDQLRKQYKYYSISREEWATMLIDIV